MKTRLFKKLFLLTFLSMSLLLSSCRRNADPNLTPNIEGNWIVVNHDGWGSWGGVTFEIEVQNDGNLLFSVPDTPYDTLWPLASRWQMIQENDTELFLKTEETTFREIFKWSYFSPDYYELEAAIDITKTDTITIDRYVGYRCEMPPCLLHFCCYHRFTLTRQTSK